MPRPTRRRTAPTSGRWKRFALWAAPTLFVLAIIGYFVAKAAINSYLHSDSFRKFLAVNAGAPLHAECEIAPLHFTGANIFTENVKAQGTPEAAFGALSLDQLRAEISLRRFFDKVWQVEQVEVQRLNLDLTAPRAERRETPAVVAAPAAAPSSGGWLPNRVEIGTAIVRDTNLTWAGGTVRNTVVTATPDGTAWKIAGQGGKIAQTGLPELDVQALALRYREPSLFVNNAEFRQGGLGSVKATGEINFAERIDLQVAIKEVDLTPFLSEDWRVRLKGQLSGDLTIRGPLPLPAAGPEIAGSLSVARGELTALPVLDKIAIFTGTQQFRRLTLSRVSANFRQDGPTLRVTKFFAESEGLIRITGDFTILNSLIDGTFQVGITPTSLAFIPGSREKVFMDSHDGYVWTSMRLTGPLNKPNEDLTARLSKALGEAVADTVNNVVKEPVKTGTDLLNEGLKLLPKIVPDGFLPGGK
ncbi:MAG: hypothetical protein K8R23_04575 [Chthoniobacter sp.]|nr:hypothetical protein [Chthoniobacter sp.]